MKLGSQVDSAGLLVTVRLLYWWLGWTYFHRQFLSFFLLTPRVAVLLWVSSSVQSAQRGFGRRKHRAPEASSISRLLFSCRFQPSIGTAHYCVTGVPVHFCLTPLLQPLFTSGRKCLAVFPETACLLRHSGRNGRIGLRRSSFHTGDGSSPVYPYLHRSIRVRREVRSCSRMAVSLHAASPFLWIPSYARSGFSSLVFLVICLRVSYRVPCSRPCTRGPAVKLLRYPAVQYVRDGGPGRKNWKATMCGQPSDSQSSAMSEDRLRRPG